MSEGLSVPTREECRALLLAKREVEPATGCWVWTGSWDAHGCGRVYLGSANRRPSPLAVAAYAWMGAPWGCRTVCHTRVACPPVCFNPAHLKVCRSQTERIRLAASLHARKGFAHQNASLTPFALQLVVEALTAGEESHGEIARRVSRATGVSVSDSVVYHIARGQNWRSVVCRRGMHGRNRP